MAGVHIAEALSEFTTLLCIRPDHLAFFKIYLTSVPLLCLGQSQYPILNFFSCETNAIGFHRTTEFPHPFLSPPCDLAQFNASTYVHYVSRFFRKLIIFCRYILFDSVFWAATAGQVNRWRRNTLKIGNTDMDHLAQSKIPFIYNFSPSVVPRPLDWGDAITISG